MFRDLLTRLEKVGAECSTDLEIPGPFRQIAPI
jgi:hypothetical protein